MDNRTTDRARRLGRELIDVHDTLRETIADLVDAVAVQGDLPAAQLRSLREHCLGFCSALGRHHASEDGTAFPWLAAQVAALHDVLAELSQDHDLIAVVLRRVEELVLELTDSNRAEAGAELAELQAVLESHFRWEERRLLAALDELDAGSHDAADLFGA